MNCCSAISTVMFHLMKNCKNMLPNSPLVMQESEGRWMFLFLQSESGELVPTQHQLQLDAHFELPRGELFPHSHTECICVHSM